jgi:hypothetical protein
MKMEIKPNPIPSQSISCQNTKIGDMMEIVGSNHEMYLGRILLKTFNGFVCLQDPSETWDNKSTFQVKLLNPGDQVILTQE